MRGADREHGPDPIFRTNRAAAWPHEPVRAIDDDEIVFVPESGLVTIAAWWRVEKGDLFLLAEDPAGRMMFDDHALFNHYPNYLVSNKPCHAFWRCRQDDPWRRDNA